MPGQTTERAVETYAEEILLTKGGWRSGANAEWDKNEALVHFAADPDEVHMTTRLAGEKTVFLPFNQGRAPGQITCGAGNPQHESGYRTGDFWEDVLRFDSLLDILGHFMFLEQMTEVRVEHFRQKVMGRLGSSPSGSGRTSRTRTGCSSSRFGRRRRGTSRSSSCGRRTPWISSSSACVRLSARWTWRAGPANNLPAAPP